MGQKELRRVIDMARAEWRKNEKEEVFWVNTRVSIWFEQKYPVQITCSSLEELIEEAHKWGFSPTQEDSIPGDPERVYFFGWPEPEYIYDDEEWRWTAPIEVSWD